MFYKYGVDAIMREAERGSESNDAATYDEDGDRGWRGHDVWYGYVTERRGKNR